MSKASHTSRKGGFTLVELLVSMVLVILLLLVLIGMTDSTRKIWSSANTKVEQFRGAREAFETITRRLSDATLNTYWDYDDPVTPTKYIRQSELRFISGPDVAPTDTYQRPTHAVFFQAPLGFVSATAALRLPQLLNTWGYFIEFSDDNDLRPAFLANLTKPPALHSRFRLMELMEPSEQSSIYTYTSGYVDNDPNKPAKCIPYIGREWFTTPLGKKDPRLYRPVAENIVALVILPKLTPGDQAVGHYYDYSLAPKYLYDSTGTNTNPQLNPRNQLPPVMQVTMVAVSEVSYLRFRPDGASSSTMPALYATGLFTDATAYTADLKTLTKTLGDAKLDYRVFTTNVSIKSAKWSTN